MKIQGHRGSKGTHPENTLAAFQEALDAGADGIELDLRIGTDGTIVIQHDPLNQTNEPILTLEELFTMLRGQREILVNLELKEQCVDKLLQLVKQFSYEKRVYYSSFNIDHLKEIRNQDQQATLSYLVDYLPTLEEIPPIHLKILSPKETLVTKKFVKTMQKAGYRVIPWTVNNPARAKELAQMGIDEIITDYPRFFKQG
jgi:glycerophosphoryl diester phosphodiesterase